MPARPSRISSATFMMALVLRPYIFVHPKGTIAAQVDVGFTFE
ncbi:MAG: hypothetical protein R2874_08665 [Desulfobacterales bacterium]